jgi:hypothetical protein
VNVEVTLGAARYRFQALAADRLHVLELAAERRAAEPRP